MYQDILQEITPSIRELHPNDFILQQDFLHATPQSQLSITLGNNFKLFFVDLDFLTDFD